MKNYSENSDKMILRDYLALDRTILANERTILAYVRTALSLIILGTGMIGIFDNFFIMVSGIIILSSSPLVLGIGIYRYNKVKNNLNKLIK